jgi:hypothetical protein
MQKALKDFFRDKDGNYSLRELVLLLSFLAILACWIGEQFFARQVPQFIFYSFVGMVTAGCFGYSIETARPRPPQTTESSDNHSTHPQKNEQ